MATDTVYDPIRAFIEANWVACPIVFDNETAAPPNAAIWLYVDVVGTSRSQQSIGTGEPETERWDEEGVLNLHFMVPVGSGTGEARRLARIAADLFKGLRLADDTIEFQDAVIGAYSGRQTGQSGDGNWYRFPVDIDWLLIGA